MATIETRSDKLSKALTVNSQTAEYDGINEGLGIVAVEPVSDGVFFLASAGLYAPSRLKIIPYADGAPGSTFTMRLYGWDVVGDTADEQVWLPLLLIELYCVVGDFPGPTVPQNVTPGRLVSDSERFCSTIQPIHGSYGSGGDLLADGITPAIVVVEMKGVRKFEFNFQQIDPNTSMNALWARL